MYTGQILDTDMIILIFIREIALLVGEAKEVLSLPLPEIWQTKRNLHLS